MAAPMVATSFQRKGRPKALQIPGTRPSIHNNQLLVSSGVPSFDSVIGGGLAVGTVLLIEEDVYGNYSKVLLKYFLAEGIVNSNAVFVGSAAAELGSAAILDELPAPIIDDPGEDVPKPSDGDESMKIAWRYQNLPQHQSSVSGGLKFGHYYDLTKTMDKRFVENADKYLFDVQNECAGSKKAGIMNPTYEKLLAKIHEKIKLGFGTASTSGQRNILRIGLHSLGSPLWGESGTKIDGTIDPSLPRFLYALRSLLRNAFAVCVLTVPTHLFHEVSFVRRIERLCDTVVQIDSFAGSVKEKNPAFKDYHGLFNIIQLPRLNTLLCHMPDSLDLAFKLRRKKFTIEKLHLPPDLSETASRGPQEDPVAQLGARGCGAGTGNSKLDF